MFHQESADKYKLVETLKTPLRSKTMGLDTKTHKLFVPMVETKTDPANPTARPTTKPGSFAVQVWAR